MDCYFDSNEGQIEITISVQSTFVVWVYALLQSPNELYLLDNGFRARQIGGSEIYLF